MAVAKLERHGGSTTTFQVHVSGSALPSPDAPSDADGIAHEIRWSVLRYRRGPRASRDRASLWRDLQLHHAVKLKQGLWAIRHHEDGTQPRLESLALIEEAGGDPTLTEIRPDIPDHDALRARLDAACDAAWDRFFHDVDRVIAAASGGADRSPQAIPDLERLRAGYRTALCRDLLWAEGATRAARRLQEAELAVLANVPEVATLGREWRRRSMVSCAYASWPLDDGTVRYALEIEPAVPFGLERAFLRFENLVLHPAEERPHLRGGLFEFIAHPTRRDDRIAAVNRRLRLFRLSLD